MSPSAPFASWQPATCLPDDCFCEAFADGVIRQPANTWSSLAFVAVAVWAALRWRRAREKGRAPLSAAEASLLIFAFVFLGLGSAFYHATFTFVGQVVDVSGMYLVVTFMLARSRVSKGGGGAAALVLTFVLAHASLMAAQVTSPELRRVVFGALFLTAIPLEWREAGAGRRFLAAGAGLMAIAFTIWTLDRLRIVCAPQSLIQGHAAWHVLSALACACLYLRYEAAARASAPSVNPGSVESPAS